MASNKDMLMKAMKGKPEVLLETPEEKDEASNVTPISA